MDEFPPPRGRPLQATFLVDSNHAHDRKTRRPITGIVGFVGSTPMLWSSKRQGSIASSTYVADFMTLYQGTEECINNHYVTLPGGPYQKCVVSFRGQFGCHTECQ